jgi:hypothetical protein
MQLVAERPLIDTIRAKMNYIVDTGTPPVRYIDWPEMEHKAIDPIYQQTEVAIRNGRPVRDTFNLDTHGFVFVDHHTRMKDFTDEAERKAVYDKEVAELIKQHSGASHVHVFDHTIRVGDEKVQQSIGARAPVKGVHNDYTEASAPVRLREILGEEEAARRMQKRWAIIQVWRPIRGTVQIDPLGICDGRTIPEKGFILVQRRAHLVLVPEDGAARGDGVQGVRHRPERADAIHRALGVRRSRHAAERPAAREHRDQDVRVLGLVSPAASRAARYCALSPCGRGQLDGATT